MLPYYLFLKSCICCLANSKFRSLADVPVALDLASHCLQTIVPSNNDAFWQPQVNCFEQCAQFAMFGLVLN
tara:strand:+ start:881 stop:1093 length:213 start_codon:yes stop_codon:yes gene_type:complete